MASVTIEVDGNQYHPSTVCQVPYCPNDSSARLVETDNKETPRRDLCLKHAQVTKRVYGDQVDVVAVWNECEMEDFDE